MFFRIACDGFEQQRVESVVQLRLLARDVAQVTGTFVFVADKGAQRRGQFDVSCPVGFRDR